MDGGRILRAALARKNDWPSATEGAVKVGRFFASLMFFGSILFAFSADSMSICTLPLIAGFVWVSGARELLAVRLRHGQSPFGQAGFATGGFQTEWQEAGGEMPGQQTVERPSRGARRPADWSAASPTRGFSEEDIENLENFHGRLPRPKHPDEDEPLP